MTAKVALIVGVGGVLGEALSREFLSREYTVVGLRRAGTDKTSNTAMRIVSCDLQNPTDTQDAVSQLVDELGGIDVLICNAAQLVIAPFAELTVSDFESTWRSCVGSAIGSVQAALPQMTRQGNGAIIISGATASTRGTARFAAFASAKFALRGLAQSLAREYHSKGIHVAHAILDGLLRGSPSALRFGAGKDDDIDPNQVAAAYRWLAEQEASSWTHELDLRPSNEKF